jgi:DNA-binding MarR family transcriptional regulator
VNSSNGLGTQLRWLLTELDGAVQQVYDELEVPFRPRFYPVVQALLRCDEMTVNGLASCFGVSQPAATQTVGEMKKLGLVESVRGTDRRTRIVRLTPKGAALAKSLQNVWRATHQAAAELDEELTVGLATVTEQALAALQHRSFGARIRAHLERQGEQT